MVGRCIPYWNGHFLGDMLVSGRVVIQNNCCFQNAIESLESFHLLPAKKFSTDEFSSGGLYQLNVREYNQPF